MKDAQAKAFVCKLHTSMKNIKLVFVFTLFLFASKVQAQTKNSAENLDKIAAIVGDQIILKSDVERAYFETLQNNPELKEDAKCTILEEILSAKLLGEQAARDSVVVSDEEIEANLDNRIRYFISMYGSEEKLEEVSGKTVYQLKDEFRPVFKDKMISDRMQQNIMGGIKITPVEVRAFYDKIPKDSLPEYPSMLEIGQIVIQPDYTPEVEEYTKSKLQKIRDEIVGGQTTFETAAGIYSEDLGSRDLAGDLGFMKREDLVPEFSAVGFKLQQNEISEIVKTKFGYHIIQLVSRQGENARLRHILLKPSVTSVDIKNATDKADSIRALLLTNKLSFAEAVNKFSEDEGTKYTGGMITSQQTGSSILQNDELDPEVALAINDLNIGQYSQPINYVNQTGDKAVRILYLKDRTEPHTANLKDDYSKIQEAALSSKKNQYLLDWLILHIPSFYVNIDEEYLTCENLKRWSIPSSQTKK